MNQPLRNTVMLVDDHPLMRRGLRQLLELEDDIDVIAEAANGEEALALQEQLQPDMVLLDNRMPRLSGVETLARLRKAGYTGKVLLFTVSDAEDDVRAALRHGADGYLLKDMEPDDLLRQVRQALGGTVVVSERLGTLLSDAPEIDPLQANSDLTAREVDVLRMLVGGHSNKLIGMQLGITEGTVKVHVKNLFQKLGIRSRVEAAVWALERLRD